MTRSSFERISRREFMKLGAAGLTCSVCGIPLLAGETRGHEAEYYEKLKDGKIKCHICPRECEVTNRERGTCGTRENREGKYFTLVYGQIAAANIDPIEKKPLFHYHPTKKAFSIATPGCNFICKFCQNWEISQKRPEQVKTVEFSAKSVLFNARSRHCPIIAHTYTEPVIFFEFMRDCAVLGKESGIPNVMISNGYIQEKPMRELCRHLGAVKIDLKAFTDDFYQKICGGKLKPVLDTIRVVREEGVWLELVVLIIPTLNDSSREIDRMTKWIYRELGPDVPLHFSRYYPTFMLQNIPPTPPETLYRCRKISLNNGLHFVYIGNILTEAANTYCPHCGALLIERAGFAAEIVGMKKNRCDKCGQIIPGVFD